MRAAGKGLAEVALSPKQGLPLIVHVLYRLQVGGMENGLVNLVNELPEDAFRHAIVCLTESTDFAGRIRRDDVEVYSLNKRPGKDLRCYLRFWRLIRSLNPSIVHTRNLGAIDFSIPAILAGVPVRVHSEHGWDVGDVFGKSRRHRILRRCCDLVITQYIAVSRDIAEWLHGSIGVRRNKIQRICNGVDIERFTPEGRRADIIDVRGVDDAVIIGTVGRLDPIKRVDVLIGAVAELIRRDESRRKRLRFIVVGDGPEFAAIEDDRKKRGLSEVVVLTGNRNDIPNVLRILDIFVLASKNEGISNTLLEATATGLPIVATDVGGNSEIVRNGVTGQLVRSACVVDLANSIERYVEEPMLRKKHGSAARRRAESEFGLQSMVNSYQQLYHRLLQFGNRQQANTS